MRSRRTGISVRRHIRVDEGAQARWRKANKGGGRIKKELEKRDAVIVEEMNRRMSDGSLYSVANRLMLLALTIQRQ